jgi:hypothetical protein
MTGHKGVDRRIAFWGRGIGDQIEYAAGGSRSIDRLTAWPRRTIGDRLVVWSFPVLDDALLRQVSSLGGCIGAEQKSPLRRLKKYKKQLYIFTVFFFRGWHNCGHFSLRLQNWFFENVDAFVFAASATYFLSGEWRSRS